MFRIKRLFVKKTGAESSRAPTPRFERYVCSLEMEIMYHQGENGMKQVLCASNLECSRTLFQEVEESLSDVSMDEVLESDNRILYINGSIVVFRNENIIRMYRKWYNTKNCKRHTKKKRNKKQNDDYDYDLEELDDGWSEKEI